MDMTSGLKEYLKMISTAGGRIFLAAFFMALAVSAEISALDQNKRYYTTGIQGRRTVKATILWRQRSWT